VICGYIADKHKTWKVLLALQVGIVLFEALVLYSNFSNHNNNISILFDIGYCGAQTLLFTAFVVLIIMLSKLCSQYTRATMFFFAGLFGSLGIIL